MADLYTVCNLTFSAGWCGCKGPACLPGLIPWVKEIQAVIEEEVESRMDKFKEAEARLADIQRHSKPSGTVPFQP